MRDKKYKNLQINILFIELIYIDIMIISNSSNYN